LAEARLEAVVAGELPQAVMKAVLALAIAVLRDDDGLHVVVEDFSGNTTKVGKGVVVTEAQGVEGLSTDELHLLTRFGLEAVVGLRRLGSGAQSLEVTAQGAVTALKAQWAELASKDSCRDVRELQQTPVDVVEIGINKG
jgi:hypothetical protein